MDGLLCHPNIMVFISFFCFSFSSSSISLRLIHPGWQDQHLGHHLMNLSFVVSSCLAAVTSYTTVQERSRVTADVLYYGAS